MLRANEYIQRKKHVQTKILYHVGDTKKYKKKKYKLHNLFECKLLFVTRKHRAVMLKSPVVCVRVCYSQAYTRFFNEQFQRKILSREFFDLYSIWMSSEKTEYGKCWMLDHFICWIFNFKHLLVCVCLYIWMVLAILFFRSWQGIGCFLQHQRKYKNKFN